MAQDRTFQYSHVEAGLVEHVRMQRTSDTDTYPLGWKYTLHLGTLEDLTLVRYDNAHEDTKGHEFHDAVDDDAHIEFPRDGRTARRVLGERRRVLGRRRRRAATALLTARKSTYRSRS